MISIAMVTIGMVTIGYLHGNLTIYVLLQMGCGWNNVNILRPCQQFNLHTCKENNTWNKYYCIILGILRSQATR